jgi:hypothetical protein
MTAKNNDDLLFGADEIAKFLGVKRHRVYYWHSKKMLPTTKVGKTLAASKRKINRMFEKLTNVPYTVRPKA